jgi:peptide chain release factor
MRNALIASVFKRAAPTSKLLFSSSSYTLSKRHELPQRPTVSEDDIEEVFIKGGGRGGQKINKTNSKVQLHHKPTGIVVSSQATRSREQNRAKAREILALKVEELTVPEGTSRLAVVAKYKQNKARKKKQRSKKKYEELAKQKELQLGKEDPDMDIKEKSKQENELFEDEELEKVIREEGDNETGNKHS